MDAARRRDRLNGTPRWRLSTLLLLAPVLAIVVGLGSWVLSLRGQVRLLEERVATLETQQLLLAANEPVSNAGVPLDVDEGMLLDGLQYLRSGY